MWSPGPMLIHMSGSRATLAQGLPGRLGGRGPAGDAEGNLTGSTQESTTWSCCRLPPLPSSSQPRGCTEVLASNISFSHPHIHFLHFFLSFLQALCPKDLIVLGRDSHRAQERFPTLASRSHPSPRPGESWVPDSPHPLSLFPQGMGTQGQTVTLITSLYRHSQE